MKKITCILPIHELKDGYQDMFNNIKLSIENFYEDVKLLIVCPTKVKNELGNISQKLEYEIITNDGDTSFTSQINIGIDNCKTEWFTIAEIDDVFTKIWAKTMFSYIDENPETDIFLSVVEDLNTNNEFIGFINESVWAYGFSEKQGFLDNDVLLEFQNFQTSGGLYRTEKIKELGKFKTNIKLTFSYEFLLRMTHNGAVIMVVPKIGYKHMNQRENSLFWLYRNDETSKLTEKEVKFWIDTARKEFFFKNMREINYIES